MSASMSPFQACFEPISFSFRFGRKSVLHQNIMQPPTYFQLSKISFNNILWYLDAPLGFYDTTMKFYLCRKYFSQPYLYFYIYSRWECCVCCETRVPMKLSRTGKGTMFVRRGLCSLLTLFWSARVCECERWYFPGFLVL